MDSLELPLSLIDEIARAHGALEIRAFGSWARRASRPRDIDLLVRLDPGRDLLDLIALKQALEEVLHIPVDVVTEAGLSPYLREQIMADARPLGAA